MAAACMVLSSKVGPNPPVVIINLGFLAAASRMHSAIVDITSGMVVSRCTHAPSAVICCDSQYALVFWILPMSNSLPIEMISMFTVKADASPLNTFALCFYAYPKLGVCRVNAKKSIRCPTWAALLFAKVPFEVFFAASGFCVVIVKVLTFITDIV